MSYDVLECDIILQNYIKYNKKGALFVPDPVYRHMNMKQFLNKSGVWMVLKSLGFKE